MQGAIAAIAIGLYQRSSSFTGALASQIVETTLVLTVPLSIVVAGLCGGFCARNSRVESSEWDIFLGVIAFMLAWVPVALISLGVVHSVLYL